MPHHSDQPMCIEGMAANWLDAAAMPAEAKEPQMWSRVTVSTKSAPASSLGGASGKTQKPTSATRLVTNSTERAAR